MAMRTTALNFYDQTASLSSGTYTLLAGVGGQKIRMMQYSISSTSGAVQIQDSAGVLIGQALQGNSSSGSNGYIELSVGASLQIVVTVAGTTTVSGYFVGCVNT